MNLAQSVPVPRYHEVAIGYPVGTSGAETYAGGFEVSGLENGLGTTISPLRLLIDNHGKTPLTFAIQQSTDNGKTDAFAAINILNKGAAVASITVQPGGRVQCDVTTLTKKFIKLSVLASQAPLGKAMFEHTMGELLPLLRKDV